MVFLLPENQLRSYSVVRKTFYKKVDINRYKEFKKVADNFIDGAKVAYEFDYYNAAGVLIIHAAIALADSITIKLASKKCSGENHYEIISLLNDVAPDSKEKNIALNHFKNLIDHKNLVSYSGSIYYKKDIDKLFRHYGHLLKWADDIVG